MIFEVYKNKTRVMLTESENQIPDDDIIKQMINSGYKPILNGKPYKPTKVKTSKEK